MLFDPVRYWTEICAEHHSVHATHLNRCSNPKRTEPHAVDEDVGLAVLGWRPNVLVRLGGRRVADPFVVKAPIEVEATKDRREFATHMDDQNLQLGVAIEQTGGDHPAAVDGRVERSANRLVETILHEHLVPDRHHRWM